MNDKMVMTLLSHQDYQGNRALENLEIECVYGDTKRIYRVPLIGQLSYWHIKKMIAGKWYGKAWEDIKKFDRILDAVYKKVDGIWKIQPKPDAAIEPGESEVRLI